MLNTIIPIQQEGAESDTVHCITLNTKEEAVCLFPAVKKRLLYVNGWHELAGIGTANFQLTDSEGKEVDRLVQEDDYFKIDIPGPGPVNGEGYDWVQVEAIKEIKEEDKQELTMRVRPASNPRNERHDVAHFFSDEATSSFVVIRIDNIICAEVHGRNEKPNTNTETVMDKARNTAVAVGAVSGLSKLQWRSLVKGLLNDLKV